MFKLFVFACLLAVAAASGVGVASTYAAPSVVSPYAYSGLGYTGGYYGSYPYTSAYASPLTYSGYGSYGSPYVRSLAYTGYGGYPYSGYPYGGYKYAY